MPEPTPSTPPIRPPSKRPDYSSEITALRLKLMKYELPPRPPVEKGGGGKPPPPTEGKSGKSLAEMASEFLREAAVLVMVFGWLDAFGKRDLPSWWGWGITVISVALFIVGASLEKLRKPS